MLLRTDPFRDLDRFTSQVFGGERSSSPMAIDAYRLGDEFVIEVDLPGVDRDSIDLTVEKNVLAISAKRDRAGADASERLITERAHGTFRRQLFLGDALDTEAVRADYDAGVLTVTVPVKAKAQPRRIDIAGLGAADTSAPELESSATES